jgi:hypothetical protein
MSTTRDPELERFKTEIDLRAYAAAEGYLLDRRESWRGSSVLRHPNGDKIIVKKDHDGHFTYFSVRADGDNGSIIDFVQHRYRDNLGQVRQRLRPWLGKAVPAPAMFAPLEPTTKDRLEVERQFRLMRNLARHPYLEETRCLPMRVLAAPRFAGRIKCDARGNAVFPHFAEDGQLCGFEIKNRNFTGYAKGGEKGLWLSHLEPTDQRLVICESAIDALSYAACFPALHTGYASLGGQLNPQQPALLQAIFHALPLNAEIVAATDADETGRTYAQWLSLLVAQSSRSDLRFLRQEPSNGKDWNEELQREHSLLPPAQNL